MGSAELIYFETENSLTRVKNVSFFFTSLSGLFHRCQFGVNTLEEISDLI